MGEVPPLTQLSRKYRQRNFEFLIVYVRESHPGENFPHHCSREDKVAHARKLKDQESVELPILVDDLQGTAHRQYGLLSNMVYLIDREGLVVYKSDWTDAASVRSAVTYFLDVNQRRRSGGRMVPFRVERLDVRDADRTAFFAGLEMAGPKAVAEFRIFIANE